MLKKVVRKLRYAYATKSEKYHIKKSIDREIKKLQDDKAKKICNSVVLTDQQMQQVDALYKTQLPEEIRYLWHQYYTAFTGNFDASYFPAALYIPKFERFMNYDDGLRKVTSDKNLFALLARGVGVKTPNVYLYCAQGMYVGKEGTSLRLEDAAQNISDIGEAFCKPTIDSNSGKGCFIVNMRNGVDTITGNSAKSIIQNLGYNFVIQEKIICHEQIKELHPNSCNTFRIITYRWKNRIYTCPSSMRIGVSGNCVDNANSGGIFVAVEPDGQLHEFAFRKNGEKFMYHPDTNIKFSDKK